MGCHALFLGIFQTQGSTPGLLHCRQILYCRLNHQGNPTHSTAECNSVPFKFHQKQVLHSKAKNMSFKEMLYENPAELFQILKDDAVKVLHSICQQIWKTQQWPQDWKMSVFIPIPKKGNTKESSNH